MCRTGPPICMGAKSAQKCPKILGAMIGVQCMQECKEKDLGAKRKKVQGKVQNQNRVPTTCNGAVGMYRDQQNA